MVVSSFQSAKDYLLAATLDSGCPRFFLLYGLLSERFAIAKLGNFFHHVDAHLKLRGRLIDLWTAAVSLHQ